MYSLSNCRVFIYYVLSMYIEKKGTQFKQRIVKETVKANLPQKHVFKMVQAK